MRRCHFLLSWERGSVALSAPALSALVLLLFSYLLAKGEIAPELREAGVLYLDDNLTSELTASVAVTTLIFSERDFSEAAGSLFPGQKLTLIGFAPEGDLISCVYRGSTLIGWIRPGDVPKTIDPRLLVDVQKEQLRREAVALAISNKKVIRGMVPDEVIRSLGRPDKVLSRTTADGTDEVWTYYTYRDQPENAYVFNAWGRPFLQTYYVKVPVGSVTVVFSNNVVTSFEEVRTVGLGAVTSPVVYGDTPVGIPVITRDGPLPSGPTASLDSAALIRETASKPSSSLPPPASVPHDEKARAGVPLAFSRDSSRTP